MNSSAGQGIRRVFAEALVHLLAEKRSEAAERVAVWGLAVEAAATVYRVAPSLDLCQA